MQSVKNPWTTVLQGYISNPTHIIKQISGAGCVIFISLGANLPASETQTPLDTLNRVIGELTDDPRLEVAAVSPWYASAPVPVSDQPWFVNGVAQIRTDLPADALLGMLHEVEERHGRVRHERNAARLLDLDLLVYHAQIASGIGPGAPVLPHPRMCERAFVLLPLHDIAPDWCHPVTGRGVVELLSEISPGQIIRRMSG